MGVSCYIGLVWIYIRFVFGNVRCLEEWNSSLVIMMMINHVYSPVVA